MKVSDCCGAPPKGNGDNDMMDYGICSECGEHCEYINEEQEQEFDEWNNDRGGTGHGDISHSDADNGL